MEMLFVHWHVNPAILHIGNFELRWYSLLFISGFILGWYIFRWFFRREGVSEKLKATDQMAWVVAMNSIRNRAEEIILREMIYGEDVA